MKTITPTSLLTTAIAAAVLCTPLLAQPMVKIDRVVPAGEEAVRQLPGVFYYESFEAIAELRETAHDLGLDSGRFGLSERDAFIGGRSIEQRYLPREQHTGNPGNAGWLWRFFGDNALSRRIEDRTPRTRVYARWYHKFEEGFQEIPPKMARMRSFGSDWRPAIYSIYFWTAGPEGHISIERRTLVPAAHREWLPNYSTGFTFNQPLNLGRWIHMELALELGEGPRSDRIQAWADGILICHIENDDLAAGFREFTINAMSWDCYWNGGSPAEQSRFYDELVLSDRPIGPVRAPVNPTLVLTAPAGSPQDPAIQVEVAQVRQAEAPRPRQLPQFERTVIWRGEIRGGGQLTIDRDGGEFLADHAEGGRLMHNALYQARVRSGENDQWSDWSDWHGTWATVWDPATPAEQRTPPDGYMVAGGE